MFSCLQFPLSKEFNAFGTQLVLMGLECQMIPKIEDIILRTNSYLRSCQQIEHYFNLPAVEFVDKLKSTIRSRPLFPFESDLDNKMKKIEVVDFMISFNP